MNSTTSLFFTSLSMNCSIAMMSSLRPQIGACRKIYVSQVGPPPQGPTAGQLSLFDRGVERSFDLEYVVLIEPVDLDDGAWRIGALPPQFLLHLVHQGPKTEHVRYIDHEPGRVAQRCPLPLGDELH